MNITTAKELKQAEKQGLLNILEVEGDLKNGKVKVRVEGRELWLAIAGTIILGGLLILGNKRQ